MPIPAFLLFFLLSTIDMVSIIYFISPLGSQLTTVNASLTDTV